MNGGQSHVDTYDYKPALEKHDGQPLAKLDKKTAFFQNSLGGLMKSPFKFKKYGQSGMDVSELWPNLGELADDYEAAIFFDRQFEQQQGHPAIDIQ